MARNTSIVTCIVVSIMCMQGCSFQASRLDFNLAALLEDPPQNIIPIAVIGSGPAGFSAALYGSRGSFTTVVFTGDKPGGLLTETTAVENWPGIPAEQGPVIMKQLQEQTEGFGAQVVYETVERVDFNQWPFRLQLADGTLVHALTVVIATGASPKRLGVPGEQEYWGKGVTACAVCDAPFFKGEEVVVIGGGDSAVEEAMQLAKYAKKVTLLVRKGALRASPSMQKLLEKYHNVSVMFNVEVQEVRGDGEKVTAVSLFNNQDDVTEDFPISGVFLAIGHIPNTSLVKDAVKTDKNGYIEVSCPSRHTSVSGVYAAGDAEDFHYRQAGVASGDGIKAGMDAITFLTDLGYNTEVEQQLKPYLFTAKKKRKIEVPHITTQSQLNALLNKSPLVIVDFYSPNCPPCMQMLPVIAAVAAQYENSPVIFVKVKIEEAADLVGKYDILKVPALLVFKNGTLTAQINTIMSHQELEELIEPLL